MDRRCSMEHLDSRKDNIRRTFDYRNLMGTCRGGEKVPRPRRTHCDNLRGSKPLPSLIPLVEACENEILYLENGSIVGLTTRAERLIELLGLDIPRLEENRQKEIKKCVRPVRDDGLSKKLTKDEAIQKYGEISKNKPFVEFCGAIMSVLNNEYMI